MTVIANITAFTGTNLAEISVNDPGWVPSTTAPFGSAIIQKSEDLGARVNGSVISKGYLRAETPGSANQTVRGVVRYLTVSTDNFSYLGARISGNNWIGASLSSSPAKVQLVKCINGVRTTVADPAVTVPIETDHEVEMTVSGQSPSISVSIRFNGVEVVNTTLTESALNPAGSVGLFHRGATAVGNTSGPRFMSFYAEDDTTASGSPPTGTVTIGTITPSTTSASVPYTYSAGDATGYQYRLDGGTATSLGASPATISGLTAATPYSIEVRATNADGEGAWSTAANFTTSAAGDAEPPTLTGVVTFTSVTETSYIPNWPVGSDNVAVIGYEYQIGSTAGAWTDAGNNLSAAITGRTAGTTETVYVRAYDAAGLRSTPAISGSVTLESALAAGINVTEPLKNNTGTLLASQSGVRVAVLQAADLVSVYETSGLTTNASGILSTISDAAIITGQQYHVAIKLADGGVGITGPITAS